MQKAVMVAVLIVEVMLLELLELPIGVMVAVVQKIKITMDMVAVTVALEL